MVDATHNVMRTFNDYSRQADLQFSSIEIQKDSAWKNMRLSDLRFPQGMAVAVIYRNRQPLVPSGDTEILEQDQLILTTIPYHSAADLLDSEVVETGDERIGKALNELGSQVPKLVCLGRNGEFLIPNGETVLQEDDTLVFAKS